MRVTLLSDIQGHRRTLAAFAPPREAPWRGFVALSSIPSLAGPDPFACHGVPAVNPDRVGLLAYDNDFPCYHWIENGRPAVRFAVCEPPDGGREFALHAR